MVTNNFVVTVLNSFLLPITEEVRDGTSLRTISTCVMSYSKFEQEPSAFIKVLTEWSLARLNKEKSPWVIHKSGRSRLRERRVAYESVSLQSDQSNGVLQCWSFTRVVARRASTVIDIN